MRSALAPPSSIRKMPGTPMIAWITPTRSAGSSRIPTSIQLMSSCCIDMAMPVNAVEPR